MNADNPYAPPEAELAPLIGVGEDDELARRMLRLAASMVDGFIGIGTALPLMFFSGAINEMSQGRTPPLSQMLVLAALNFGLFLAVHGYFLKSNGQTLGKKLAGIRIATLDGGVPDFGRLIALRYLPISIAVNIPRMGPYLSILDVLFIFRADRRCIHDLIAGTKVVVVRTGR